MAIYDYKCENCEFEKEIVHGMSETPQISCDLCGGTMHKMIPKSFNFVLKGDGWAGKNIKEKEYRTRRYKEMGKKMAQSHDILPISPNYKGEVCKSWDEAKKLAVADGADSLRYEKQVESLKGKEKETQEKRNKLLKGEG